MVEPEYKPENTSSSQQSAATNLSQAFECMSYEVEAGKFALVGFEEAPAQADLESIGEGPGQLIREGGETSVLLPEEGLEALLARHPQSQVEADLIWIRFRAPMSWDVVGFLAKVTSSLAAGGVPLGAVCGFSRDHLFIHERYLETSLEVLDALFKRHTND
ncbi:MAG: hypothetical protein ACI8X5_000603 [Planctomycetota bacterium]|jgi:hypothetical protein